MKAQEPRITGPMLRALGALMLTPDNELSGAEIGREANLASGTLYPILLRLELAGWLASRWEAEEPAVLGRPRRRYYRVTGLGAQKARAAVKGIEPVLKGGPAWA